MDRYIFLTYFFIDEWHCTQCGGIQKALLGSKNLPESLRKWIAPIEELKSSSGENSSENSGENFGKNSGENSVENLGEKNPTILTEMNIRHQVEVISQCKLIKALWEKGKGPEIHGWLFQMETGLIKKICRASPYYL